MSAHDPGSLYQINRERFEDRLERRQHDLHVRAARPNSFAHALRLRVSAILVRLSGWVDPTVAEPATESALVRLAR